MEQVVKTSVFIQNMDDFGKVNEIYAKYFEGACPAFLRRVYLNFRRRPDGDASDRQNKNESHIWKISPEKQVPVCENPGV